MHRTSTEGGMELPDNGKDGQILEGTKAERRSVVALALTKLLLTAPTQIPGFESSWHSGLYPSQRREHQ